MKDIEYNYHYDDEGDKKYCYPNSNVLINKLNIQDLEELHEAERDITILRIGEIMSEPIKGNFSLKHLQKIHLYIFKDIYEWAGKIRTVDISKGTIFCLTQFIEIQFNELYQQLKKESYLTKIDSKEEMAKRLSYYFGIINMIHPFREGNGRTQRVYFQYLCNKGNKFELDFSNISRDDMIEASILSSNGDDHKLEELFLKSLYIK